MKRIVPLVFLSVTLLGCSKDEVKPAPVTRAPQQEMRTADPAAFVTATFHSEQAQKRGTLRRQIDSLTALSVIDRKHVVQLVNRRKGELMSIKKSIRNSTMYNATQRDSLIAPLDDESLELAGDLVAVSK